MRNEGKSGGMGKIAPKVNESAEFKIIITVSEIRGQDQLVIDSNFPHWFRE